MGRTNQSGRLLRERSLRESSSSRGSVKGLPFPELFRNR